MCETGRNMTEAQIDNAISTCVVGLKRHVMDCESKAIDEAYRDVYGAKVGAQGHLRANRIDVAAECSHK